MSGSWHSPRIIALKGLAGGYHVGVILAVKTALWLLKSGTRDPRLDPFQCFSIWYFWIPGQDTKINMFLHLENTVCGIKQ